MKAVKGILLARDTVTQELIPYVTADDSPPWSLTDRCVSAIDRPESSYIWWIHARRSERTPDRKAIEALIDACWARGWPERMQRMQSNVGTIVSKGRQTLVQAPAGVSGAMVYGPFAPIMPGSYVATMRLRLLADAPPETIVARVDAVIGADTVVLAETDVPASSLSPDAYTEVSLEFSIKEMKFGYQSRVISTGAVALSVEKKSDLIRLDR